MRGEGVVVREKMLPKIRRVYNGLGYLNILIYLQTPRNYSQVGLVAIPEPGLFQCFYVGLAVDKDHPLTFEGKLG